MASIAVHSLSFSLCRLGWGYNANGQLAQGDNYNRGDHAGEMGNSLPPIRLGVGFEVMTVSTGRLHACAVSTDGDLKCWG